MLSYFWWLVYSGAVGAFVASAAHEYHIATPVWISAWVMLYALSALIYFVGVEIKENV